MSDEVQVYFSVGVAIAYSDESESRNGTMYMVDRDIFIKVCEVLKHLKFESLIENDIGYREVINNHVKGLDKMIEIANEEVVKC